MTDENKTVEMKLVLKVNGSGSELGVWSTKTKQ
jgi:hypothetical protein